MMYSKQDHICVSQVGPVPEIVPPVVALEFLLAHLTRLVHAHGVLLSALRLICTFIEWMYWNATRACSLRGEPGPPTFPHILNDTYFGLVLDR